MYRKAIIAVVLGLVCASCASQSSQDSDWIRFSTYGMIVVKRDYSGTISRSGVVQLKTYDGNRSSNDYRAYLSQAEREQLEAAIEKVVREHGSQVWLSVVTDVRENRIEVLDQSGGKRLSMSFDPDLACYDLDTARSMVELWNTFLVTIQSPNLRTTEELIICSEPRPKWPYEPHPKR